MSGASGVVFDNTVNLGNVLTMVFGAVVWAITLAIAWTKLGGRIDLLQLRVTLLEKVLERIALVLDKFTTNETEVRLMKAQIVALETQYTTLHQTVEDLRRGKGWINDDRGGGGLSSREF